MVAEIESVAQNGRHVDEHGFYVRSVGTFVSRPEDVNLGPGQEPHNLLGRYVLIQLNKILNLQRPRVFDDVVLGPVHRITNERNSQTLTRTFQMAQRLKELSVSFEPGPGGNHDDIDILVNRRSRSE